MNYYNCNAFKRVIFFVLMFVTFVINGQVIIKSQSFDNGASGYSDDLGPVPDGTYGYVDNTTSESAPNSFYFTGSNNKTDLIFDNVDISLYENVTVTVSFSAKDVDDKENLILYISYDDGQNYNNSNKTKLIHGKSASGDKNVSWGIPDSHPSSAGENPYTFSVPDTETSVKIKIQAKKLDPGEFFYIDNVIIKGVLIPPSYCDSYGDGNDTYTTGISNVTFNTINNASAESDIGYSDFIDISTYVTQSADYDLSVNLYTDIADGAWTVYARVWIDWNQDFDFDDPGEQYDLGTAYNVTDGATSLSPRTITIPAGASLGPTRMRVSARWDAYSTSCEKGFDGEVEDYTIVVIDDTPKIDFNGADSYVDFGDNFDILSGDFTFEAWVLQENTVANGTIISKGDSKSGSNKGYEISVKNNFLNLTWYDSSGIEQVNMTASHPILNNKWHHIAITYDYSVPLTTLYIDGIAVGFGSPSITPGDITERCVMGASHNSDSPIVPNNYFDGFIDEVRIWGFHLSKDQLHEMMNQEIEIRGTAVKGKVNPRDVSSGLAWASLIGYYDMNNNDAIDKSLYSTNGTAVNSSASSQEQTAPLPYYTKQDGDWDNSTSLTPWQYGDSVWNTPNGTGINGTAIDWNIVRISNNINVDRDVKVLALISESTALITDEDITDSELTIGANGGDYELNITHYLKLDGKIDLQNESQLIQGDGSWLDEDSSGYLERDQQGTANSFTYNYWSSPVSKRDINANNVAHKTGDVLRDGHGTQDIIGTLDFDPDSSASIDPYYADGTVATNRKIATYWMYRLINNQSNDYSSWDWVGNYYDVNITEGYSMKGIAGDLPISDEQNYVFRGKPNNVLNGDSQIKHTTFPASFDTNGNPRISLTGNPFPSAIDAWEFIDDNSNSINGQLYFWEHWGGGSHKYSEYQGGYSIYTKAGGTPAASHVNVSTTGSGTKTPERYIPIGQGFFVIQKHDVDGSNIPTTAYGGDVIFKNSQRIFKTEKSGDSQFTKESSSKDNKSVFKTSTDQIQRIRIGFESSNGFYRQIMTAFLEGATDGHDYGYDGVSGDFLSNDAHFYQDERYYVIQAFGEFSTAREIPLAVFIGENNFGVQKFSTESIENLDEGVQVFIKDNSNGEIHEITDSSFDIHLDPGTYKERFSVVFKAQVLSNPNMPELENGFSIFMNNSQSEINVNRLTDINIEKITLFNSLGQRTQSWSKGIDSNTLKLSVDESTGIYVVVLKTAIGTISKKILIE